MRAGHELNIHYHFIIHLLIFIRLSHTSSFVFASLLSKMKTSLFASVVAELQIACLAIHLVCWKTLTTQLVFIFFLNVSQKHIAEMIRRCALQPHEFGFMVFWYQFLNGDHIMTKFLDLLWIKSYCPRHVDWIPNWPNLSRWTMTICKNWNCWLCVVSLKSSVIFLLAKPVMKNIILKT